MASPAATSNVDPNRPPSAVKRTYTYVLPFLDNNRAADMTPAGIYRKPQSSILLSVAGSPQQDSGPPNSFCSSTPNPHGIYKALIRHREPKKGQRHRGHLFTRPRCAGAIFSPPPSTALMADYYVVGAGTGRLPSDRRTEREQRYAVSGGPMAARNAAGAGGGGGADRRSLSPSPSISDGISRRFCGCASSASSSKVGGVMVSDSPTQWLSTDAKAAEELEDMRVRDGAGGGRGGAVDPAVAAKRKSKIRRLEVLKKAIYGAALAMLTAILLIQVTFCHKFQ